MRIMNPTQKTIILHANSVIASVSAIQSDSIISLSEQGKSLRDSKLSLESQNEIEFDLSDSDLTEEQKKLLTLFLNRNRDQSLQKI